MERDILAEVNHPFIVKLHYGKYSEGPHNSLPLGGLGPPSQPQGPEEEQPSEAGPPESPASPVLVALCLSSPKEQDASVCLEALMRGGYT